MEEFTVGSFLQPRSDAALEVQTGSHEDWWRQEKSRLEATSAEWKRQRDELDAELTATKAASAAQLKAQLKPSATRSSACSPFCAGCTRRGGAPLCRGHSESPW